MSWRRLFEGFFLLTLVDGFFANWLYPAKFPLLFKDFYLIFVFFYFITREQAKHIMQDFSYHMGKGVMLAAFGFFLIAIFQIFNPLAPGLLLGLLGFRTYFLYWLTAPLAYAYIDRVDRAYRLIEIIVFASIPVNIVGLLQFFWGPDFMIEYFGPGFQRAFSEAALGGEAVGIESFVRIIGTFASTGQYSNFLDTCIMFTFALIFSAKSTPRRIILLGVQTLNLLALLGAGSRGSMLFLILTLGAFVFLARRSRAAIFAFVITGIIFFVGFRTLGAGVTARFKTLQKIEMIRDRTVHATGGQWAQYFDRFPMGRGLGCASTAARHLESVSKKEPHWYLVENYLAKLQLETGLVGVVTFFLLIGLICFRWLEKWLPTLKWTERHNALCLALTAWAVPYFAFISLFGILDTTPGYIFLWTTVGIIVRIYALIMSGDPDFQTNDSSWR